MKIWLSLVGITAAIVLIVFVIRLRVQGLTIRVACDGVRQIARVQIGFGQGVLFRWFAFACNGVWYAQAGKRVHRPIGIHSDDTPKKKKRKIRKILPPPLHLQTLYWNIALGNSLQDCIAAGSIGAIIPLVEQWILSKQPHADVQMRSVWAYDRDCMATNALITVRFWLHSIIWYGLRMLWYTRREA